MPSRSRGGLPRGLSALSLLAIIGPQVNTVSAQCSNNQYYSGVQDPNNNNVCLPCPSGVICNGSQTVNYCLLGQYVENNSCQNCQPGYYCSDPTLGQIECPYGTYTDTTNQAHCKICPAGSRCQFNSASPEACDTGTFSLGRATECTKCPAGFTCSTNGQVITQCKVGTYSALGESDCQDCTTSRTCPDISGTLKNLVCDLVNYYADDNHGQCLPCPAGTECQGKNCQSESACSPCSSGEYSISGGSCTPCDDKYICDNSNMPPKACPLGSYRSDATTCTTCSAGNFCPYLSTSEQACPIGSTGNTYGTGSWHCITCANGFDCTDPTNPTSCRDDTNYDGKYCQVGLIFNCPVGTYRDSSTNAGRSMADCKICEAGFVCSSEALVPGDKTNCPQGYYCPRGTTDENAFPCKPGYYNDQENGKNIYACKICPAGKYCGETEGQTQAQDCPAGFYCLLGQTSGNEHPCPAGTYNHLPSQTSGAACQQCPVGNYCPEATDVENGIQCPIGTYNLYTNQGDIVNCRPCQRSFYCDQPGMSVLPSGTTNNCQAGHYCPIGTIAADQYPCQPGTFSDQINLFASGQCEKCPAGQTCGFGSTSADQLPCPEGHYCPAGSCPLDESECKSIPIACPAGKYNPNTARTASSDCQDCQSGTFCEVGSSQEEPCPAGFYCPINTKYATQFPCPAGTYNPSQNGKTQSACIDCSKGQYCVAGSSSETPCPSIDEPDYNIGTYANTTNTKSLDDCKNCPAGSKCDLTSGTVNPTKCLAGTYSKDKWSKCETCLAGYYCENDGTSYDTMMNSPCEAGYHCDTGQIDSKGGNTVCSTGNYCPEGTPKMIQCPPGTFMDETLSQSVEDCKPCTEGYFCTLGQTQDPASTTNKCSEGFYCPRENKVDYSHYMSDQYVRLIIGSTSDNQVPCPPATYLDEKGGRFVADCKPCEESFYCREGSPSQTNCPNGFYCPANSSEPTPCPTGTYLNEPNKVKVEDCNLCPIGQYCDGKGMTQPRGDCDPGFLCYNGSYTSQPDKNVDPNNRDGQPIGELCPQGQFCLQGALTASNCKAGYFNPQVGAYNNESCISCSAGKYCDGSQTTGDGEDCPEGYFCVASATEPAECGVGNYCLAKSSQSNECPQGTYQPSANSSSCLPCDAGEICSATGLSAVTKTCPVGHYCPKYSTASTDSEEVKTFNDQKANYQGITDSDGSFGTYSENGIKCPRGTFQSQTSQSSIDACIPCTKGQYCATEGLEQPTGNCNTGYICIEGNIIPNPYENVTGGQHNYEGFICPTGHWCDQSVDDTFPIPCPEGTYRDTKMGQSEADCRGCEPGYFCDIEGKVSIDFSSDICPEGYYCAGNNTGLLGSNPPIPCSVGKFCPEGSAEETTCPEGTYQDSQQKGSCIACGIGKTCLFDLCSTTGITGNCQEDCPPGYYCQNGFKYACPIGTYSTLSSLSDINSCEPCPSGRYCADSPQLTDPPEVNAGYYSDRGAKVAEPSGATDCNPCYNNLATAITDPVSCTICDGKNCESCGICPEGSFCEKGSIDDTNLCPAGTFGAETGLTQSSDCSACPPGKACLNSGTIQETIVTCDEGYICEESCDTKTPDGVNDTCGRPCDAMYYCPAGSVDQIPCQENSESAAVSGSCSACEAGYTCRGSPPQKENCGFGGYCQNGIVYPCPIGTYSNTTENAVDDTTCLTCPDKYFCGPDVGVSTPTICPAGYYCESGQSSGYDNICQVGYCCDEGSNNQTKCDAGKDCSFTGLSCTDLSNDSSYECDAGYYCPNSGTSLGEIPCPAGYYCIAGSTQEEPCPAGTFNPYLRALDITWCQPCPPGKFCPISSSATIDNLDSCDDGYYCEGANEDAKGKIGNTLETLCALGHNCTAGLQSPCNPGTFQANTGTSSCDDCPSGTYCPNYGMASSTPCEEGFYCLGGANRTPCPAGTKGENPSLKSESECTKCQPGTFSYPQGSTNCQDCTAGFYCGGDSNSSPTPVECSSGHYCPAGTATEEPCDPGTYSDITGLTDNSQCYPCPIGKYCDGSSPSISVPQDCQAGYFCDVNSTNATAEICPEPFYCQQGQDRKKCPAGTYSNSPGQQLSQPDNSGTPACQLCPAGRYCNEYGILSSDLNNSDYDCPAGYYCQENSGAGPCGDECSIGSKGCCDCSQNKVCPKNSSAPSDCPSGEYVTSGTTNNVVCMPCPAGSSCQDNTLSTCEVGFFCPANTTDSYKTDDNYKCPEGTFSTRSGGTSVEVCQFCTAGYFCDTKGMSTSPSASANGNNFRCQKGYYCPVGSTQADQVECPAGYMCPEGADGAPGAIKPTACSPGSYQPATGQETCEPCPAGSYCPFYAMTGDDTIECPIGNYCELGSRARTPCPIGTYGKDSNQISESLSCLPCKATFYCDSQGLTEDNMIQSNACNKGYYCPEGTSSQTQYPCSTPGFYCDSGQEQPISCPENYYCGPNKALTFDPSSTGDNKWKCRSGCVCSEQSPESCPELCPAGQYCLEGQQAQNCPLGTFRTDTGGKELTDCTVCTEGYYCDSLAMQTDPVPSNICDAGYYCPSGSINSKGHSVNDATDKICPVGYKCPAGSSSYYLNPCHGGKYQNEPGQSTCKDCLAGTYCPYVSHADLSTLPIATDDGYYSDDNAITQLRCVVGTYYDSTSANTNKCTLCPAGKFCDSPAMIDIPDETFNCTAGYFCKENSNTPSPFEFPNTNASDPSSWGNGPCPPGHYCVAGVIEPEACPAGTYRSDTTGVNVADCTQCSQDRICNEPGMTTDGTACPIGKNCTSGIEQPCDFGYYCDGLTYTPQPCPIGTYNDLQEQDSINDCKACPAGEYCESSGLKEGATCTSGYYCPEGSVSPTICPSGMYQCNLPGLECPEKCDDGQYSTDGTTCIDCPPGFVCNAATSFNCSTFGTGNIDNITPCPIGKYCDSSTLDSRINGIDCPKGTYNTVTGRSSQADCQQCTPGYNCDSTGLTSLTTTELCPAGFYCQEGTGSDVKLPESCDPGYYCPVGSSMQIKCQVGTYNENTQQSSCALCTAGKFCSETGLDDITKAEDCPAGYYCTEGIQRPLPCPAGKFSEASAESESDCANCPAGKFCESGESNKNDGSGTCQNGYYCDGVDGAINPDDQICPVGAFCECSSGCSNYTLCAAGKACPYEGMLDNDQIICNNGYYCDEGATTSIPKVDSITFGPCLPGTYCQAGTSADCPAGSFFPGYGISQETDCPLCPDGQYCSGPKNTSPTGFCDPGYVCKNGADTANDVNNQCPAGFKCLDGTQFACGMGTYQNDQGQDTCKSCDTGKICDLTDYTTGLIAVTDDCPQGGYCEGGDGEYSYTRCPKGTFNDLTGKSVESDCQNCPAGFACPDVGTINASLKCAAGYYCNGGSDSQYPPNTNPYDESIVANGPCPSGYFCEEQTDVPVKCPIGSYMTQQFGTNFDDCISCPAGFNCNQEALGTYPQSGCTPGYYCPGNTCFSTNSTCSAVEIDCPVGQFCPAGSKLGTNCPKGKYQPDLQKSDDTSCLDCPSKHYCTAGSGILDDGSGNLYQLCPDGYYCDGNIESQYEKPCPVGFQCNNAADNPILCADGTYTDIEAQSSCQICEAGFYCKFDSSLGTTKKLECPEGSFCEANSTDPEPCPLGYYGQNAGLKMQSECNPCPPGKFCDQTGMTLSDTTSKSVDPGYYCEQGCDTSTPDNINCTGDCVGGPCPSGYQCPGGTSTKINCDDGYYQDELNKSECKICEAGYYCEIGANGSQRYNCPKGHYCSTETSNYNISKCPIGTFNEFENMSSLTDCTDCTAGKYCSDQGLAEPTGDCYGGFYCPEGMDTPAPGQFRCQPGFYCPIGSSVQKSCDATRACPVEGLDQPSVNCTAGYHCPEGSASSEENICPTGQYCEASVSEPSDCPKGTYNPNLGASSQDDCVICPPGQYCEETVGGLAAPTGQCDLGFYCNGGANNATQNPCPAGSKCPQGSKYPILCQPGTYQNAAEQGECLNCPIGKTCGEGQIEPDDCPTGRVCESGTKNQTEPFCPDGTYDENGNLGSDSSCQSCPEFKYCLQGSIIDYCDPGYFCNAGSSTAFQNECTEGNYCEDGESKPCPDGFYSRAKLSKSVSDCQPCQPGYYCKNGVQQKCTEGYICYQESASATPSGDISIGEICPIGYKCTEGAVIKLPCNTGFYQDETGKADCKPCPEGYYCPPVADPISDLTNYECPAGFLCPANTINKYSQPCEKGTYNDLTGKFNSADCKPCPAGYGCDSYGISDLERKTSLNEFRYYCVAGYYCEEGSDSRTAKECPAGSYCPTKAVLNQPCPAGTYSNKRGLEKEEDCTACDPGRYCATSGLTTTTGDCDAGTFCASNSNSTSPSGADCPEGHCCPTGTSIPIPCNANTYFQDTGNACNAGIDGNCDPCPAGFWCKFRTGTNYEDCPVGMYCPVGTAPIFCPDGTYSDSTGQTGPGSCQSCPPGNWCEQGQIIGKCDAGYICTGGATTPRPTSRSSQGGYICPVAYYCVEGSSIEDQSTMTCSGNTVITYEGAMSSNECVPCPDGYICTDGIPELCPKGKYCQGGQTFDCPIGTYQPAQQKIYLSDCVICDPGYDCNNTGIDNQRDYPCQAGSYCLQGTGLNETLDGLTYESRLPKPCPTGTYSNKRIGSVLACLPCPAGQYCLEGVTEGTDCQANVDVDGEILATYCPVGMQVTTPELNVLICQAGFYCPDPSTQIICPAGSYCNAGSSTNTTCPAGSFCELVYDENGNVIAGASYPTLCPLGTIDKEDPKQTTEQDTCTSCTAGTYSSTDRSQCLECQAGVYCHDRAYTDIPPDDPALQITTEICPAGKYCVAGTTKPANCPLGTFNSFTGATSESNCLPCAVNFYQNNEGQTECKFCGAEATQPAVGQSTCLCNGNGRNFQSSDNQCPCAVGYVQQNDLCIRKIYPLCKDGTTRTQFGDCYTPAEWENYCRNDVCGPNEYIGYNRVVGSCICNTKELDDVCNLNCREKQQLIIRLECPSPDSTAADSTLVPEIVIRNETNQILKSYNVNDMSLINNGVAALTSSCANQLQRIDDQSVDVVTDVDTSTTIYLMDINTERISGVYNPSPNVIIDVLDTVVNTDSTTTTTSTRRRRQTTNSGFATDRSDQLMDDPVICAEVGSVFMWSIEDGVYPKYDVNNLFNQNTDFDYGGFRSLEEQQAQTDSLATVFAYEFAEEGSFAFYLADPNNPSNDNKYYMYIKITGESVTCPDLGPYFPPTETYIARSGLYINTHVTQEADWTIIIWVSVGFILSILWSIGAILLFKKYGWDKMNQEASYRKLALAADFSQYASKGSTVTIFDKEIEKSIQGLTKRKLSILANHGDILDNEKFWNYSRQVDLADFSSKYVYTLMEDQADKLSAQIAKQGQEAAGMYRQVALESANIKNDFAKKVGLEDRSQLLTKSEMKQCLKHKKKIEKHIFKRRKIAQAASDFYKELLQLRQNDLFGLTDYIANMQASVQEAIAIFNSLDTSNASDFSDEIEFSEFKSIKVQRLNELHIEMSKLLEENNEFIANTTQFEIDSGLPIFRGQFLDCSKENYVIHKYATNRNCLPLIVPEKNAPMVKFKPQKIIPNGNVVCQTTGLTTHILAATRSSAQDSTGSSLKNKYLPLGGTINSVFTDMKAPIEYLGLCDAGEEIGVVIGVTIDSTGQVCPRYLENLSARKVPQQVTERSAINLMNMKYNLVLIKMKDSIETKEPFNDSPAHKTIKQTTLEISNLITEISYLKLHEISEIKKYFKTMNHISVTGTQLGIYEDIETGMKYSCIPGSIINDPSGSGLDVPILGAVRTPQDQQASRQKGKQFLCRPIAGSMKSVDGNLAAIVLGDSGLDSETGQRGYVVGGRLDKKLDMILPVVTKDTTKKRPTYSSAIVRTIENEIIYRTDFFESMAVREKSISSLVLTFTKNFMHYMQKLSQQVENTIEINDIKNYFNKLGSPIENYAIEFEKILEEEIERRNIAVPSISSTIGSDLGKVSIIDPIMELTLYDHKEAEDIRAIAEALYNIKDIADSARDRIVNNAADLQIIRNLQSEIQVSVNNRVKTVMKSLAKTKISRRLVSQSAQQALSDLSDSKWVATELEWKEMLVPIVSDNDVPMEELIRELLDKLKNENRYYLSPDAINLVDTSVELPKTEKQIEKAKQEKIKEQELEEKQKQANIRKSSSALSKSSFSKTGSDGNNVSNSLEQADDEQTKKDVELLLDSTQLQTKIASESALFARALKGIQAESLNTCILKYDTEKQTMLTQLKNQLLDELKNCQTEEDKLKLIDQFAERMRVYAEQIDERKKLDISQLIDQIAQDEKEKKEEFYDKQRAKAVESGVDPMEVIPNIDFDDEYEAKLKEDLEKLAEELQKLGAEISKDWPPKQLSDDLKDKLNEQMQAKINAINALRKIDNNVANVDDVINDNSEDINNYVRKRGNVQNKLKNKMKRRTRKDNESLYNNSDEFGKVDKGAELLVKDANNQAILNTVLEALDLDKTEKIEENLEQNLLTKNLENLKNENDSEASDLMNSLINGYKDQCDQLKNIEKDKKDSFKNRLQERLNARADLLKNQAVDKAAASELLKFNKNELPDDVLNENEGKRNNFDKLLTRNQVNQLDQLEKHHDSEQAKLEKELNAEKLEEIIKLDVNLSDQLEKQQNEIDMQVQKNIEASAESGKSLDSDQVNKMLEQANQDKEKLRDVINTQKAKQLEIINKARRDRRDRKVKLLQEQQKLETNQVLRKLDEERHVEGNKFENHLAAQQISGSSSRADKKDLLQKLLHKQAQEIDKAVTAKAKELDIGLEKLKQNLRIKRENLRDNLLQKFTDEQNDLLANTSSEKEREDLPSVLKDLELRKEQALNKFDSETEKLLENIKVDSRVELEEASKILALREKHLNQLADAIRATSGMKGKLIAEAAAQAEAAAKVSKNERIEIITRADLAINQAKKEKKAIQQQIQKERDLEIERKQKELDRKMEVEKEKELAKLANKIDNKEKAYEQKTAQDITDINNNQNLTQDVRDKLIKEAEENERNRKLQLSREKSKMKQHLVAKLNARKAKKQNLAKEEILAEHELSQIDNFEANRTLDKELAFELVDKLNKADPIMLAKAGELKLPDLSSLEKDLRSLLDVHNKKLNSTEFSLSQSEIVNSMQAVPGLQLVLLDHMDKHWTLEGKLTPVKRHNLDTQQLLAWRYAQFSAGNIARILHLKSTIKIKAASTLPNNNYLNNAFRKSFYYDHNDQILWIRDKRFSQPSELLIIVAHCMAHIINKDDFDDTNGDFIRNLYFALKLLSSDSFSIIAEPALLMPSIAEQSDQVFDSVLDLKFRVRDLDVDESASKNSKNSKEVSNMSQQNKQISDNYHQTKADKAKESRAQLSQCMKDIESVTNLIMQQAQMEQQQSDEVSLRLQLQDLRKLRGKLMADMEGP